MKILELESASPQLRKLGDDAAGGPLVLTQNGKPVACVVGLRDYDAEQIETMADPEFWKMIQHRRRNDSDVIPFEKVRRQLELDEQAERQQSAK